MSDKSLSIRYLALGVLALGAILISATPITASAQVAGTVSLTVAPSPAGPPAGRVFSGQANALFSVFDFSVSGGSFINVTGVRIGGIGFSTGVKNIYVYDGATLLGSAPSDTKISGIDTLVNFTTSLRIYSGTSRQIALRADVGGYPTFVLPGPAVGARENTPKADLVAYIAGDQASIAMGQVALGIREVRTDLGVLDVGYPVGNIMSIVAPPTEPSITITSPSGGETWQVGGTYNISWSASSDLANSLRYISGVYVSSGGTMGIEFALNTLGHLGSYSWTIPSTWPTGQWKIRVGVQPEGTGTYVDSKEFSVVAAVTNKPPVITVGAGPTNLNVNQTGTWTLKAYDPDGTYLAYSVDWGEGTAFPSQSKSMAPSPSTTQATTFDHTYATAGTYKIVFTVSDEKGASTQASTTVVVGDVTTLNRPPVLNPMAVPAEVRIGQSVNFTLNASDPDGDAVGWDVSWGDGRGDGVECSAQRNPFYITHTWAAAGNYLVKARANDCRGGVADTSFTINVGGLVVNNPPKIIGGSTLPTQIEVGGKVYLTWQATDPDGDALSWSVDWGDKSGTTSGICSDSLCTKYAGVHSWAAAGTYPVVVKVTDNKGGFDRSELKVPVGKVSPPFVGGMKAPRAGNYALKMNWFNASARTFIFLPQAAVGLTSAVNAGATSIVVTQNPASTTGRYFIFDKTNNSIEELVISGGTSGGCSSTPADCKVSTMLTLASPTSGSYTTEAKVAPLLALYQGYYPPVGESVNLGSYAEGQEIVVGHISQWWGKLFGPVSSNDPDYYLIDQTIDSTPASFRLNFDDGLHFNWSGRGIRSGYNDGSFDVYYSTGAIPIPSPVPMPQPTEPQQPTTSTPVPTTPSVESIKLEASGIFEGRVQDVTPSSINAEQAGKLLDQAQSILSKIQALRAQLDELTPALAAVRDFVALGTPTTEKLGLGERAGVVNSFRTAFGKVPQSEAEWSDVIKIANGRFPSVTNPTQEKAVETTFEKIYLRAPDRAQANDNAAVTVMAYGLRSANRNLASETAAIKSFKAIFNKVPTSASDWDAVRAIAYSGAKR